MAVVGVSCEMRTPVVGQANGPRVPGKHPRAVVLPHIAHGRIPNG